MKEMKKKKKTGKNKQEKQDHYLQRTWKKKNTFSHSYDDKSLAAVLCFKILACKKCVGQLGIVQMRAWESLEKANLQEENLKDTWKFVQCRRKQGETKPFLWPLKADSLFLSVSIMIQEQVT